MQTKLRLTVTERAAPPEIYITMSKYRPGREQPLALLTVCHALFAAALATIACIATLSGGSGLLISIHDPSIALGLVASVATTMAAGAGISAFILINVERAQPRSRAHTCE